MEEIVETMDDEAFADALAQLCVAQAVYKRVAEVVSTKDPNSLRSMVQGELMRRFEATGTDRVRPTVCGVPVGTLSVTMTREEPERTDTRPVVVDHAALEADGNEDFMAWLTAAIKRDMARYACEYAEATGELLDGMEWQTSVTPAKPSVPKGTVLRVDPAKVSMGLRLLPEGREALADMLLPEGE